jgi:hypothetical protein
MRLRKFGSVSSLMKENLSELVGDWNLLTRFLTMCLYPSRTAYRISQSEFRKAHEMMPIKGPGEISQLVRGPSYVWAILHDPRIRTTG